MSGLIISVSGLRGIIGENLTPVIAMRYAAAFAAHAPLGPFVLTRDGRSTGRMLADAIRASLAAVGRDVYDVDIAATPTTGVLVRQLNAAGGIQVSASHNPPEYNGIKLFGADGRVISADDGEKVLESYQQGTIRWGTHHQIGRVLTVEDPIAAHLELVLDTVGVERIRSRYFRVLLDSNHGAGSILGIRLLEELGCECIMLGATPDGRFEHTPEPTAVNLQAVCKRVEGENVDVGFAQDPDADRLALIDELGNYVGEEFTLAVCLDHVLRQHKGSVVTNCSTSRMSEDLALKYGVPFLHAKVGEANVTAEMIAHKAVFGGEGNGGPIDPRVGYVRDSFVGMALVLDALASRECTLSQLIAELPQYAIHKTKAQLSPDKVAAALNAVAEANSDAKKNTMDGLRLDWPGRWLLIRASNTEPIVRIIAEAETPEIAEQLCLDAQQVLSKY
ncbi:MAG: phosphoglucosamine mutase [Pirellulaceae bacterium]|nr:phosphoglucosamine mutase [Planctomycetales bacterium]